MCDKRWREHATTRGCCVARQSEALVRLVRAKAGQEVFNLLAHVWAPSVEHNNAHYKNNTHTSRARSVSRFWRSRVRHTSIERGVALARKREKHIWRRHTTHTRRETTSRGKRCRRIYIYLRRSIEVRDRERTSQINAVRYASVFACSYRDMSVSPQGRV